MKRSWKGDGKEEERGEGERNRERERERGKVGERSKGYLHRVVFFPALFVRTVCRTAQPADLRDDEHELHSI